MPTNPAACIEDHFADLTDPRQRNVIYPLVNVVTIAICAVICGADDFVAIAKFGRLKQEWLSQFLDLKEGIPSHDRFNAILAAIKPAEFEACLLRWITALHEIASASAAVIVSEVGAPSDSRMIRPRPSSSRTTMPTGANVGNSSSGLTSPISSAVAMVTT